MVEAGATELRRCPASRAVPGRPDPERQGLRPGGVRDDRGLAVLDRRSGEITTWSGRARRLRLPRQFLQAQSRPYVVLAVAFDLPKGSSALIKHTPNWRVNWAWKQVVARRCAMCVNRPAVAGGQGMVFDAEDPDMQRRVLLHESVRRSSARGCPGWAQPDGRIKTSAAWLIENAGVHKGFRLPGAQVAVSSKHTCPDQPGRRDDGSIADLAREIRSRVEGRFGITLEPEPVLWGCSLWAGVPVVAR